MHRRSLLIQEFVTIPRNRAAGGRYGQQRGFVLITMAVAAVALIGVVGVAVDMGRMFIAKNETQSYCDAAALAAALALAQPLEVGMNINSILTSGNKASEAA